VNKYHKGIHDDPWSLPLARSKAVVRYWVERLKATIHSYALPAKWRILQDDLQIAQTGNEIEDDLIQHKCMALKEYRNNKNDAIPLRDKWLDDLAEAYAQGDDKKKAKRIKALRRKEK